MSVNKRVVQPKARENRYKKASKHNMPRARGWLRVLFFSLCGAGAIIAMSLVFIFGHDWATQCDYFRTETVEVKGCQRLLPEDVMEAAGINEKVNILSVNLPAARRRILAMGWVAEAEIRREFPSAMTIRIMEHQPVARIDFGRTFLVNKRSEIFREADADEFSELPVIRGVDYTDWQDPGGYNTPLVSSVMTVLRFGQDHNSVFANHGITSITVDRDLGLVVRPRSLPVEKLQLGYGNYERKLRRLEKILSYLKHNEPSLILEKMDLRNPDRIVARPAMGEESLNIRQKEA